MGQRRSTLESLVRDKVSREPGALLKAFPNIKGKNILVTGVTGLLGNHLIELLEEQVMESDNYLVALVRDNIPTSRFWQKKYKRLNIVFGSITDFDLIKRTLCEYDIDLVFHLAAQTQVKMATRNPLETINVNVMGTSNILEAARQLRREGQNIHVIVASSDKAYGNIKDRSEPYTEDMELHGSYPYDVSKSCVDLIAQSYFESYKLPIGIVRCGNLFGAGDLNYDRIIPMTILSYIYKKNPVLRSDGTMVRDYIYVKDAVIGYMTVANKSLENEEATKLVYNISSGNHLNVLEVVDVIKKQMDPDNLYPIEILNRVSNEIPYQTLSSDKIKEELHFLPRYSFEEAIGESIEWYKTLTQ